MQQYEFGEEHLSGIMMIGTTLLYFISVETMHQLAGIATIFAGISTGIYNIYKAFKKK